MLVAAGAHWDVPNDTGATPATIALDVGFDFLETGVGVGEAGTKKAAKAEEKAARLAGERVARRRTAEAAKAEPSYASERRSPCTRGRVSAK